MGASSRSPSPITILPRIGMESMVRRMDSTATLSDNSRSPRPMVRAQAMAAFSTTRRNLGARSLSMFSPKLLAFTSCLAASELTSVAITYPHLERPENIARLDKDWKGRRLTERSVRIFGVFEFNEERVLNELLASGIILAMFLRKLAPPLLLIALTLCL